MIIDKNNIIPNLARSTSPVVIDIGCGNYKKKKHWIGIDFLNYDCVDIVGDIFDVLNFEEPNAEDKIMKMQSCERIMKLVSKLPEDQREIIILRHFADLKFREISKILDCSVNTALGRMRYALLNLRKLIEEKQIAL